MKGPTRRLRLSPNEEARIIKEEKERRRKLRLVQVREQAKVNAAKIRQAVKQERENQISLLAAEIKDEWEEEKAEKVRKLQEIHLRSLRHVGDAHVNATQQEPTDVERALIEQENLQRAAQRHLEAIKKMKDDKKKKDDEANRQIVARKFAIEQEKERAAEVAALPPRDPDPVKDISIPKVKPIKLTDVNAFSSTHLHMPMEEYAVERAQPAETTDAHQAAVEEQERVEAVEEAERVAAHERQEKARLRHKHARQKELLKQDYDHMLQDLSDLRRTDISRRQQVVAKIPRAVYQAPHRRLEEKEEDQREMEAAFEDMYMAATENQGDLTLALDRHPPPAITPAGSSALDLSLEHEELGKVPQGQRAPFGAPLKDLTNLQKMAQAKHNVSGLSKLMGRIEAQRESWAKQAEPVTSPPPHQQPMAPLQRDLSSTTTGGSLTQYTISSASTAATLEESTTDASSVTTLTGSKASSATLSQRSGTSVTVTDSDITTTTEGTLEEGTISSSTSAYSTTMQTDTTGNGTLLHPMEIAAKVRQKPLVDSSAPMASFLDQRKLTNQPNLEQLVQDFRQEQQRLEKERKKLEKKMKDLEDQSMKLTPLELAQKYLRELPPLPPEEAQPLASTDKPDISNRAERSMSSSLSQADKVRLYQQRALERKRGRDDSRLSTSMDRSSAVPSTPSPQRSPVGLHSNVSIMTSPTGALSSISGIPADNTANTQHQLGGSPYSGKSGQTTDLSQQSYHSHDFDARQIALKAQLAEIEQQRADILARQQRYHNDMHQTKERWQRELEQYSLRDSQAAAERSLSLLTSEAQNQSNQVEMGQEDHNEWVDSDDAIDEDLLRRLNNLPHKATDHKYKIQRRKPASKAIKVPNKSPVMPHDLSTIQELDTPLTDKKHPTHQMNSTELDNRKEKPSASRSLFDTQMQTVPEAEAPEALDYNSRYAPPNDLYFMAGLGQFEPPALEQPRTPQQLSQHFTKVPSEVDTLSAGRSEDFADMYGDRNYVGLESKTIERPLPSIDQVQEIHRLPDPAPSELVIASPAPPPPPPVQDFMDYQGDHTAFSTTLSTGPLVDDGEYHPDSAGIMVSYKETVPKTDAVQDTRNDELISTQRYSRSQSHEETPPRSEPQPLPRTPTKPYSPTSSSPKFEFTSHYVPLKDQGKDKNWKKELAQYNMSYLTPPKMSPARPTDKIVRCITTRAFGCERPVKGTAKTKAEMEEKHRANLIPAKDMRSVGMNRVISPEEKMSPSRIREMFEQTSGSNHPMGSPIPKDKPSHGFRDPSGQFLSSTPSSESVVSRLRTGDDQVTTPTEPIDRRSMEGSQNWSGSGKYERPSRTSSFTGNDTVTPGERSSQSSLSQYKLDSDADTTKTPANASVKTDGSLEQYPLSASAGRSETMTSMSLSQYTLEDSRRFSAPGGSPPGSASFARSTQGQGFSTFQPLMEMSRSSDGSARSAQKSTLQSSGAYGMQDSHSLGQTGWTQPQGQFMEPRTMGAYSVQPKPGITTDSTHQTSAGPSQSVVDFTMDITDISKQAEAAMERYDRMMDESRRLRQKYEAEEHKLMAEARSNSRQSSKPSEATIEQNLSRSLERLAQEETGISEEPDITLVSVSSTPQKVSPLIPDQEVEPETVTAGEQNLVESQADSKASSQPRSLLSFEQHEQSLATMSQVSLIRPGLSDEKNSMTSSLARSGGDTEPLTPYASSSSAGGSSLAASGPQAGVSEASSSGAKGGQGPKEERTSTVQENQKHMSRTLASWKKNNALSATATKPTESSSAATSISMTTKTSADQKKKEREMKQRTEKLYSQLEDVKQHRQEKQRQEDYAVNRQRKLEYQKNYQEQLRKKYQDKKK